MAEKKTQQSSRKRSSLPPKVSRPQANSGQRTSQAPRGRNRRARGYAKHATNYQLPVSNVDPNNPRTLSKQYAVSLADPFDGGESYSPDAEDIGPRRFAKGYLNLTATAIQDSVSSQYVIALMFTDSCLNQVVVATAIANGVVTATTTYSNNLYTSWSTTVQKYLQVNGGIRVSNPNAISNQRGVAHFIRLLEPGFGSGFNMNNILGNTSTSHMDYCLQSDKIHFNWLPVSANTTWKAYNASYDSNSPVALLYITGLQANDTVYLESVAGFNLSPNVSISSLIPGVTALPDPSTAQESLSKVFTKTNATQAVVLPDGDSEPEFMSVVRNVIGVGGKVLDLAKEAAPIIGAIGSLFLETEDLQIDMAERLVDMLDSRNPHATEAILKHALEKVRAQHDMKTDTYHVLYPELQGLGTHTPVRGYLVPSCCSSLKEDYLSLNRTDSMSSIPKALSNKR